MEKPGQNFVSWEHRFSINIPLIDSQHKKLIDLANELHKACRFDTTAAKEQFRNTIREAVAYVQYHFSVEEQLMTKTAYKEFTEHKKHHTEFIQEVLDNVAAFENGKKFIPNQFVRFLRDWVLSHIAIVDIKFGEYIVNLQKNGKLSDVSIIKESAENEMGKKIVLAVDDSKTQLIQFKSILTMYDVHTCESPLQALEMAKNMAVDIILLDLDMPDLTGIEFLQHLQQISGKHQIPVIIVSGNSTEKLILASKNEGAIDFIVKPVEPELLIKKIQNQLVNKKIPAA